MAIKVNSHAEVSASLERSKARMTNMKKVVWVDMAPTQISFV